MNQSRLAGLGQLLHTAHSAERELEEELGGIGLSLAKLAALRALSEAAESLPLTQLADRLSCVKSNITQLVDRLEGDGLVERQADPGDRRARLATLTAAGRKACREGLRLQSEVEQRFIGKLSAGESEKLGALLDKLIAG